MNTITARPNSSPRVPWWRVGVMWLFVGGLGVVVAGSFALLATAVKQADVVLPQVEARSTLGVPGAPATAPAPRP